MPISEIFMPYFYQETITAALNVKREEQNELSFGVSKTPSVEMNFHSQIELYIITSGEVEVLINDRRRILKKGDIAVAFSYDAHGYKALCPSTAYYLIIPTNLIGEFLPLLSDKRPLSPFIDDEKIFTRVTEAMERMLEGAGEIGTRGYIYVILSEILKYTEDKPKGEAGDPNFSAEILIYINKHFKEELPLSRLASEFGYNSSYFSRAFTRTFGVSYSRYLTMIRLREAVLLMKSGELTVTECALESGFGSSRSFYRAFYEEFGCAPKDYLRSHR